MVGCWLVAADQFFKKLRRSWTKKKLDRLVEKIKLAPRNLTPLISRN